MVLVKVSVVVAHSETGVPYMTDAVVSCESVDVYGSALQSSEIVTVVVCCFSGSPVHHRPLHFVKSPTRRKHVPMMTVRVPFEP